MRNKSEKSLIRKFCVRKRFYKFQEVCKSHVLLDSNPKRILKTGKRK